MFDLLKKVRDIIVGGFEAIGTFFEWVGGLFQDIINLGVQAGKAVANIGVWFTGFIPAPALALLLTIFGVVIIYKILGREG